MKIIFLKTTMEDLRRQFMQNELLLTNGIKTNATSDSAKRKHLRRTRDMVEIIRCILTTGLQLILERVTRNEDRGIHTT